MQREDVERLAATCEAQASWSSAAPELERAARMMRALLDRAERAEVETERLKRINREHCNAVNALNLDGARLEARLKAAEAERDAAFAAGQEERRVALVYDEDGNIEVYADPSVTIISVCCHTPEDRLYRLNPAPIPDGMLDGYIGHAGDETRADRLATAAAEAIAEGVDVLADPGAVFSKVRSN